MITSGKLFLCGLAVGVMTCGCVQRHGPAAPGLPAPPTGWTGPTVTLAKTNEQIEQIIDGEANQYYEYDLLRLTRGIYAGPTGEKAIVDVYKFPSAADAFGAYSQWRDGAPKVLPIGAEGFETDEGVNCYNGRFFFRVKAAEPSPAGMSVAKDLAAEAAGQVKAGPVALPHLKFLPRRGRLANSVVYVKRNFAGREFLTNAVTARYEAGKVEFRCFICAYEDAAGAAEALGKLKDACQADESVRQGRRTLAYRDEFDGEVTVVLAGRFIVAATAGRARFTHDVAARLQTERP